MTDSDVEHSAHESILLYKSSGGTGYLPNRCAPTFVDLRESNLRSLAET